MEIRTSTIHINEIEAPNTLYKYRNWVNDNHKTIITERTVFMAPPSSFEDEKEFRNFKRYDLMSDKDIYEKYLHMSKEHNKQFSRQQHRTHAREWTKKAPFKDLENLKRFQEEHYSEYDERVGVLSLTAHNGELDMWNYYSNRGEGFCIGLDSHVLFTYMGGGGKVEYPEDGLPIIYGNDPPELERWKQIFNKELKWKWEKEYRVDIFNPNGLTKARRQVALPIECFKEVIFGWSMSKEIKHTIVKACESSHLEVSFYDTQPNEHNVLIIPFST